MSDRPHLSWRKEGSSMCKTEEVLKSEAEGKKKKTNWGHRAQGFLRRHNPLNKVPDALGGRWLADPTLYNKGAFVGTEREAKLAGKAHEIFSARHRPQGAAGSNNGGGKKKSPRRKSKKRSKRNNRKR